MGQELDTLVNKFDASSKKLKEQEAALNTLLELADAQLKVGQELIYDRLFGARDGHNLSELTMPITHLMGIDTQVLVSVKKDAKSWGTTINKVIDKFGAKKYKEGIEAIVSGLVSDVLGAAHGKASAKDAYTCYMHGFSV